MLMISFTPRDHFSLSFFIFCRLIIVMKLDDFVNSLHRRKFDNVGMFANSSVKVAKECVVRHRAKDGFICHYFSGSPIGYMTAEASQTFLVVPGSWAKEIICCFQPESLKGPSIATQEDKDDEEYSTKFNEGVYGVVFEMSFDDAKVALSKISAKLTCRYTMLRFILNEYSC